MLARAMYSTTNVDTPLFSSVDSRDLFSSPSTQSNSVDKSIRCDFNDIRYEFELKNVAKYVRIPANQNLVDPGAKNYSPVLDSLRLTLETGRLHSGFPTAMFCYSHRSLD